MNIMEVEEGRKRGRREERMKYEEYMKGLVEERVKEEEENMRVDKELQNYGRKVYGGYMLTIGDFIRYFADKEREKNKKRRK